MRRWQAMRGEFASTTRRLCLVAVAAAVLGVAVPARAQTPAPYSGGAQWFSLLGGYARSGVENSANGNVGFGLGYSRFRNAKWAFSGRLEYNLLGKYGGAAEIEAPLTLDLTRHYKWRTQFRPYLGVGAGVIYHKFYRTGDDATQFRGGGLLVGGGNVPISDRSLLGLDGRVILEASAKSDNPVFPNSQETAITWGLKLVWSQVF